MAKKKEVKGHEADAFGYHVKTERGGVGWGVTISQRVKPEGKARIVMDRDGFDFEGQALDWGHDWALENRPYTVEVKPAEKGGFIGQVVNEHGFDEWRSGICSDGDEAQALCDAFVSARRHHDKLVLAERRRLRADARMIEADLRAAEVDALGEIDAAKAVLKKVEKDREQLRKDLEAPQIEFNFVAELERQKVHALRGLGAKQVDLEDHVAGKEQSGGVGQGVMADKLRGHLRRVKDGEAPTPV